MKRDDIETESSGNLQVGRKRDTYYLKVKEDLSKFYSFSLRKKKKQQIG